MKYTYALNIDHPNEDIYDYYDGLGLSLETEHIISKGDIITLDQFYDFEENFGTKWFKVIQKVFLTEMNNEDNVRLCCLLLKPTKVNRY